MDPSSGSDCPPPLADLVWTLLLQVSFDRASRYFGATAAELNLAPTQAIALRELEAERPISMRELAERLREGCGPDALERLRCHPSNITGVVDRLEARGLVERRPDPRDRRVKGLALTPDGQQLRIRLGQRLHTAPLCVAHLPEPDQRTLHELLLKIVNHM
jgi:DNA-binding MarR family transcriptional regulator